MLLLYLLLVAFISVLSICSFNNLTERFFKNSPWPEAEIVAPVVQNGAYIVYTCMQLVYVLNINVLQ